MLTRDDFTGPWAGLPVAWTADDRFDESTYRADVARCCAAGVPGVYTGGTTGEFYAMEFDEFQAVARATVEECHTHDTPAMIGCSTTYTLGAQRRAEFAAGIDADAIQVAIPFWMKTGEAEIETFFSEVSKASGGLPLSVYETPRCKVMLSLDQHRALHARLPNYLMVKSTAGTIGSTPEGCRALSEFVNVFTGENRWQELGPCGVRGSCSSLVYWNPQVCFSLWRAVAEGDWETVRLLSEPISRLYAFLHEEFGRRGLTDTAFDRLGGLASGFLQTSLRSRGPYVSASPADVRVLREWYASEFPEMLQL